ncbi:hypothetical protein LUZ61_008915 [Rhynchospora tenuis]|uniref:PGG domain-containing protein n=1 Tax=Rhynchospora tenuis TaxID=198213 RepID=A0AAD5ZW86_9POAL|nr:hypothetical protein LUZ61_008915 [Rhynchospora tenuis]
MDPALHKAVTQGDLRMLKIILTADPESLLSRTPQQNTALHIAARLGHRDIADRMLKERETLLLEKNIDGDTPLHVASKFGKIEVADLLINYSLQWPIDIESEEGSPFTTKNKLGNTALHEAVTHGKSEVALRLLEANPNVGHILNEKHESPLHIASREGMVQVVKEILKQSWVEEEVETQTPASGTGSPLHQAVLGGHIKIVEMLLYQRNDMVKLIDSDGNNALHYAAQNDNGRIVEMLITKEPSLAYGNNHWGQPPLHVAVYYGAKAAIRAILKHCPDTAEQFGHDGGNALHVAVNRGKFSSLKCLLRHIQPEEIINHQDNDGNTPLHLAAKQSRIQSSLLLLKDRRVNPCLLNNKRQTARSAIEMLETSTYDMFVWRELKKQEAKRCKKQQLPAVPSSRSFGKKKTTPDDYFELSVQTYTVVAALIATVTFAAVFTMPGGYQQNEGYAILGKKPAFKPFVISTTIAMCSALVVVFCFIWAWRDPLKFKLNQLKWGHRLIVLACLSMIVSLMTAIYLVVEPESRWLSIVVILIGCSTPIVVWLILGPEVLFVPL